ncbi:hypothetical protein EON65_13780 [archaeon]|nr:MAG: hypothetical protein EON65_13780 [archaeon]
MPCFIVSCLEMESNVNIVKRCGKASYVRKYLELAINEYLGAIREGTSEQVMARKSKLRCMTDLLPPEMWQVALLAWSLEENTVKPAKILHI